MVYAAVGQTVAKEDVESGTELSGSSGESAKLTDDLPEDSRWRLVALGMSLCLFHILATYPLPDELVFIAPVNRPYHHMRLTVFFAFGIPFLQQVQQGYSSRMRLCLQPLLCMLIFWLTVQSILLAIIGLWLQLSLAMALLLAVVILAWPLRSTAWLWDFASGAYRHLWDPDAALRVKIYTVVFSIFPFGLLMPIFAAWDPVELWVRWRPYNIQAELLWRGTFATFALAFFLAAANPKVNNSIVAFFAAHGICHSISMFVDNRIFPADGNDNLEHLLEISIFMVLGLTHCFVGRKAGRAVHFSGIGAWLACMIVERWRSARLYSLDGAEALASVVNQLCHREGLAPSARVLLAQELRAPEMWKRAAGWRDKEFYPWLLQTSAILGCAGALVICGCIFVPGLGWKIAVGTGLACSRLQSRDRQKSMASDLLLRAAQRGDIEEAALLLESGHAQPNVVMPPSDTTPLHAASRAGNLNMVNLLLEAQANPNAREVSQCGGRAALHLAAQANLTEIANNLLAKGANPVMRDSRGQTPLHLAALEGHADVTRLLLGHGGDPNMRDYAGFNAAWWAKEFKHQEVLDVYAAEQVQPLKITARERLDFSGVKFRVGGKKKKKEGERGKSRDKTPSGRRKCWRPSSRRCCHPFVLGDCLRRLPWSGQLLASGA
eukprot:s1021_g7.t1